jgi:hypothetical protein
MRQLPKSKRLDVMPSSCDRIVSANCNTCGGDRKHDVLHAEVSRWTDEIERVGEIGGEDSYEMLRCRGCGRICLRHQSSFSEDKDPETGRPLVVTRYYPPATSRKKPNWLSMFSLMHLAWNEDDIISDLLDEIYEALHNDARRLAAMGVRSLLEQIMIDKVGQQKSFKLLVNTFAEKGFISPLQKERIETILEAGHASVHRSFKPHVRDLMTLMDIAESLVADIYVHPRRVEQLTSKIPTRGVKSTD